MNDDAERLESILEGAGVLSDEQRSHLASVVSGILSSKDAARMEDIVDRNAFDFFASPFGWIRRDGAFLPCAFSGHDNLLKYLGTDTATIDDQGWVRVSKTGVHCFYRMTPAQKKTLRAKGGEVDTEKERLKPHWHGLPPFDESVHPAYRMPRNVEF